MIVRKANPGNLPGILAEAAVGVDGVPISSPTVPEPAFTNVDNEIKPTIYPASANTTSRHVNNKMSQTAS